MIDTSNMSLTQVRTYILGLFSKLVELPEYCQLETKPPESAPVPNIRHNGRETKTWSNNGERSSCTTVRENSNNDIQTPRLSSGTRNLEIVAPATQGGVPDVLPLREESTTGHVMESMEQLRLIISTICKELPPGGEGLRKAAEHWIKKVEQALLPPAHQHQHQQQQQLEAVEASLQRIQEQVDVLSQRVDRLEGTVPQYLQPMETVSSQSTNSFKNAPQASAARNKTTNHDSSTAGQTSPAHLPAIFRDFQDTSASDISDTTIEASFTLLEDLISGLLVKHSNPEFNWKEDIRSTKLAGLLEHQESRTLKRPWLRMRIATEIYDKLFIVSDEVEVDGRLADHIKSTFSSAIVSSKAMEERLGKICSQAVKCAKLLRECKAQYTWQQKHATPRARYSELKRVGLRLSGEKEVEDSSAECDVALTIFGAVVKEYRVSQDGEEVTKTAVIRKPLVVLL